MYVSLYLISTYEKH